MSTVTVLSPSPRRRAGFRRFSATATALLLALIMAGGPGAQYAMAKKKPRLPDTMLPLRITDVFLRDGQLFAAGTLGDTTFESPLVLTPLPNPADPDCPILDLALGPIHLNLLGLNVDTSPICLAITAHEGGGLLGDLLCGISGLLADGLPLGTILGALNADELTTVLDGIADLLNAALTQATAPAAVSGAACDILNLSLGPVNLNLLGLEVMLDDCDEGPVTIDVTAVPGGGLLGDLLCNLSDLLDSNANSNAIANALNSVANAILALL